VHFFSPALRSPARIAVMAALAGFCVPAFASLGSNVNSVEADRAHMNAVVSVSQGRDYAIHQIQSPAGTEVDEYVSSAGTVFAVSWHGMFAPDMQQILGTYFQQYVTALQAQPHRYGHPPLNIQADGLVIQTGGHIRAHFGRAYLPSQLPESMTADQIR
jgi:hypothetical protein